MIIQLNGVEKTLPEGTTVGQLLAQLGQAPMGIAVEINREVIPRSLHALTLLQNGDRVEIVHMVGGG